MVEAGDAPLLRPGLYESLITETLESQLDAARAAGQLADRTNLDPVEAPVTLASYVAHLLGERLATADHAERVDVANAVIDFVDARLSRGARVPAEVPGDRVTSAERPILHLVQSPGVSGLGTRKMRRPEVPLTQSDLLINGRGEPNLIRSLASEMDSADHIRIIVRFIKWSGLALILPEVEKALRRGAQVQEKALSEPLDRPATFETQLPGLRTFPALLDRV